MTGKQSGYIAANQTETSITIRVVNDTNNDDGEGIEVVIDSVSVDGDTAQIGAMRQVIISIVDDDSPQLIHAPAWRQLDSA